VPMSRRAIFHNSHGRLFKKADKQDHTVERGLLFQLRITPHVFEERCENEAWAKARLGAPGLGG